MLFRPSFVGALAVGCALFGGFGGFGGLTGCAYGEVRQVIRAQFAAELSCPEVSLRKRDVWYSYEGPDQYKVTGCGVIRTYTCPAGDGMASYDEPACTWVAGDADAPQMSKDTGLVDEGAPPTEGGESEPMDADQELDAAESHGDSSHGDDLGSSSDAEADSADEPAPAKPAPAKPAPAKKPAGKLKASGGLKLGGKKK